ASGRGLLLTHPLQRPKDAQDRHLISTYKGLLKPLGIPLSDIKPKLFLSREEENQIRNLLSRHGVRDHHQIIGINPGAAYGSAKCWLPERFREVTMRLLEDKDR